jgi:hypothetical protein
MTNTKKSSPRLSRLSKTGTDANWNLSPCRRSVKKPCEDGVSSTSQGTTLDAPVRSRLPAPLPDPELSLEFCSANDPVYLDIRRRHYVVQKGTHGQQVHFKVWYRGKCVGIISGASAVFATASRDAFFKLTKNNRTKCLNGIIDNTVFRLELHERNLAGRIVSLWEKSVVWVWENLYEVKVFGFETFIIPEGFTTEEVLDAKRRVVLVDDPTGKNMRKGATYRAVGWSWVGQTSGNTKGHDGVPLKDVFCKWAPGFSAPVESKYASSWKANTREGTDEMKALAKWRSDFRRTLLGTRFYRDGKVLIHENISQTTLRRIEWNAPGTPRKIRSSKMRPPSGTSPERENLRETEAV